MAIVAADDLFHTPPDKQYTWTETNWFGMMFIPEKKIQFDTYVWVHPNMKVVYSGLYAARGRLKDQLCADYYDYRCWLPMMEGNLDNYSLANGLSVKILKPLMTYQLDYVDAARGLEMHVIWDGIMPPVPFPHREHLEQAGRVTGTLKLNGETHQVDCISIRDHSWVHRPEIPNSDADPWAMLPVALTTAALFASPLPIAITAMTESPMKRRRGWNRPTNPKWILCPFAGFTKTARIARFARPICA
jgi:hypothetical protein